MGRGLKEHDDIREIHAVYSHGIRAEFIAIVYRCYTSKSAKIPNINFVDLEASISIISQNNRKKNCLVTIRYKQLWADLPASGGALPA